MEGGSRKRSTSRNRPSSRPTTPLRPSSRTSLRESQGFGGASRSSQFPLEALEPAFAELSDSMADLEANFMHLQLMHESLSRFSESFASFLYGLNMNAFCVDFPEAPISDSFKRASQQDEYTGSATRTNTYQPDFDAETTFMTTDASFVENPSTSSRSARKYANPAPAAGSSEGPSSRGGTAGRGNQLRGAGRGTRGSGLARAKPRGAR
ncbi:dash complex subunit dam1 [Lasallia pustulata]|uniref:DASH complex subunit DAM1 n=1 Tax=Lasallia pustulata TaxID=136370 RepID=A0A1W5D2A4_9LECA|nr:dash complex subunit dam1 [Lasallia pustulata]